MTGVRCRREDNAKKHHNRTVCELDLCGSEYDPRAVSCENGNENSGTHKLWKI